MGLRQDDRKALCAYQVFDDRLNDWTKSVAPSQTLTLLPGQGIIYREPHVTRPLWLQQYLDLIQPERGRAEPAPQMPVSRPTLPGADVSNSGSRSPRLAGVFSLSALLTMSDLDAYHHAAAKRGQDDGRVIEVTYSDDEDEVKNEYRRATTAVQSTHRQSTHRGNGTLADPICIDP